MSANRQPADLSRRALIVKLGAIGDVVMAIPAVYAVHREGYEIDWVAGTVVAPVLRLYRWVNVIEVDDRAFLQGRQSARVRGVMALWRRLGRRRYAICATLYYDRRYRLLTAPVRARRKVTLSETDRRFALIPGRHHTDEFARILLERKDSETPLQLAPVGPENLPAPVLVRDAARPRVVMAPAGAKNLMRNDALRRWPIESYARVAAELIERGIEVVLVGGPDDTWASPLFAGLSVVDLIGKLSLVETVAVMNSAEVTVTHDTGPLHLAGITSTAIVAIFGPTDPHGRLPQRENCVGLWGGEGFACRPCYDGRDYAPCEHNGCVRQVTPEMVIAEIERMLEAKQTGVGLLPRVVVPEHTPLSKLERAR